MKKPRQKTLKGLLACCAVLIAAICVTRGQLFSTSAHLLRQAMSPVWANTAVARTSPPAFGVHDGTAQFDWIIATLDRSDTDCMLAFYHSPAYSIRLRENSNAVKPLFKLLQAQGVTAVLNGHNDFYERTRPLNGTGAIDREDGMRTFIVGTGGKVRKREQEPARISGRMIAGKNGILKLDLRDGAFDRQFIAATDGKVLDEGTGRCRQRTSTRSRSGS